MTGTTDLHNERQPRGERRRRWAKRREFDRAICLSAVANGEALTLNPDKYCDMKICSCTIQPHSLGFAGNAPAAGNSSRTRSPKEVKS